MSDQPSKWRSEILDAIEQLRHRKTRPDGPRIAQFVARKLGVRQADVLQDLERLVDEEAVVKVDYKGSISYRDMTKWVHTSTPSDTNSLSVQFGVLHNSIFTSDRIMKAMETLSGKPVKVSPGSTVEQVDAHISSLYPRTKLRGEQLEKCLLREVDCGRLVQLTNNSFILADRLAEGMEIKRRSQTTVPLFKNTKDENETVKTDGKDEINGGPLKRKMNKTDKLDMALRKKKRTRICLECVEVKGEAAAREGEMLECMDCDYATHPECGGYSLEIVDLQKGRYKCMQCKRCKVCNSGVLGQDKELIICFGCDNCYHMACHTPPVDRDAKLNEWTCEECKHRRAAEAASADAMKNDLLAADAVRKSLLTNGINGHGELNGTESNSTWNSFNGLSHALVKEDAKIFGKKMESESVVSRALEAYQRSQPPKKTPQLIKEIESWSVEDVAKKFTEPAYADAIRKHCIDGAALILLTRDDVVLRFGLPFVQALKLYRDICVICPFGPFSD